MSELCCPGSGCPGSGCLRWGILYWGILYWGILYWGILDLGVLDGLGCHFLFLVDTNLVLPSLLQLIGGLFKLGQASSQGFAEFRQFSRAEDN